MFISIGVDCGPAILLANNNLRHLSLPFDYIVTYNGISDIIINNFNNYLPSDTNLYNKEYCIYFMHNNFPNDSKKI